MPNPLSPKVPSPKVPVRRATVALARGKAPVGWRTGVMEDPGRLRKTPKFRNFPLHPLGAGAELAHG